MITLSQINIFPIKSMAGISVEQATVTEAGLVGDRRLMLINDKGKFVTARQHPRLLKLQCEMIDGGLKVSVEQHGSQVILFNQFAHGEPVSIWRDLVESRIAPDEVNQWFSHYLNLEVKLCLLATEEARYRDKIDTHVSFADGYPFLLIGEQSLQELNQRATEPTTMTQFRTNFVISGSSPFAEDTWQRIKIGEVEFELSKPCERCVMTTVDPDSFTIKASREPLKTLATFRSNQQGRLMFGENLVAKNYGVIRKGDEVIILSTKLPIKYGAK